MIEDHILLFSRSACRSFIDRLKDGEPPPPEAIEFLTIGYDNCLDRAKQGLNSAKSGRYDVMLLEGPYGIGKSHMLARINVIAREKGFKVKHLQVGDGRVYFNDPEGIYKLVLGDDEEPGYYYRWYGDRVRKFVGQVKALAEVAVKEGWAGLAILLDELENTCFSVSRFPSRAKAYRFLGSIFKGHDEGISHRALGLDNVFVAMAITPGLIEWAKRDGSWTWIDNPADGWRVPDRVTIRPLASEHAVDLGKRIRAIHSKAFDWNASDGVGDVALAAIVGHWMAQGETRDERQLVKLVVEALELAEQDR